MKGIAKRKIQKCNTFFPIHFVFLQTPSPNLSPWSQNLGVKTPLLPVANAPNLSAFLTPETPGQLPESSAKDFCRYVFLHAQVWDDVLQNESVLRTCAGFTYRLTSTSVSEKKYSIVDRKMGSLKEKDTKCCVILYMRMSISCWNKNWLLKESKHKIPIRNGKLL